jgi:putative PIN family toxin of toxin-antitoxin system
MSGKPRFVLDTNVLISALMLWRSKPRLAWNRARRTGVILASHDTLRELASVLRRPKLAAYVSPSESAAFLTELARVVELVPIGERVELCRDPRDDKFLELALAGRADFLLTGDADLLELHPFRGTAIITPAAYLDDS